MTRVAVLSDVHGNLTAFRTVLADIERRGIATVVNLGDTVGKGPRGSACVALAREQCTLTVRGNWDEWLSTDPPEWDARAAPDDARRWWRDELSEEDRRWLRSLPFAASMHLGGDLIRFVHASAAGVTYRVHRAHSAEDAAAFFAPSPLIDPGPVPAVACYGDLHTSYVERTPEGLLVNVGSVGNPLDEPTPVYAILSGGAGGIEVEWVRVGYDVEAELAAARDVAMPEYEPWARELREAHYRGLG